MNDQLQMVIRYFLTVAGTLATGKGWITPADLSTLTADLLAAMGPLMMLGSFLWGWYLRTHNAKIASVNAIPGVKVVPAYSPGVPVSEVPKV